MATAWLPAFVLLAAVVAGCTAPGRGIQETTQTFAEPPLHGFTLNVSEGARRVVLRTLEAGVVTLNAANHRNPSEPQVVETCGAARAVIHGAQNVTAGFLWAESHGRALLVARDGAPTVIENPLAFESTWLATDFDVTMESVPVAAGDLVVLDAAWHGSAPSLYAPGARVEGVALELVQDVQPALTCGANLVPFNGTFVASGIYPALVTAVHDAEETFTTEQGTEALWTMISKVGACHLGIAFEGATVAETTGAVVCGVHALQGPGQVTFWADTTAAYNVVWLYFLLDVPPLPA